MNPDRKKEKRKTGGKAKGSEPYVDGEKEPRSRPPSGVGTETASGSGESQSSALPKSGKRRSRSTDASTKPEKRKPDIETPHKHEPKSAWSAGAPEMGASDKTTGTKDKKFSSSRGGSSKSAMKTKAKTVSSSELENATMASNDLATRYNPNSNSVLHDMDVGGAGKSTKSKKKNKTLKARAEASTPGDVEESAQLQSQSDFSFKDAIVGRLESDDACSSIYSGKADGEHCPIISTDNVLNGMDIAPVHKNKKKKNKKRKKEKVLESSTATDDAENVPELQDDLKPEGNDTPTAAAPDTATEGENLAKKKKKKKKKKRRDSDKATDLNGASHSNDPLTEMDVPTEPTTHAGEALGAHCGEKISHKKERAEIPFTGIAISAGSASNSPTSSLGKEISKIAINETVDDSVRTSGRTSTKKCVLNATLNGHDAFSYETKEKPTLDISDDASDATFHTCSDKSASPVVSVPESNINGVDKNLLTSKKFVMSAKTPNKVASEDGESPSDSEKKSKHALVEESTHEDVTLTSAASVADACDEIDMIMDDAKHVEGITPVTSTRPLTPPEGQVDMELEEHILYERERLESATAETDEYGLDAAMALEAPGEWVPTVFKENPTETELAREEAIPYNPIRSYAELTGAEEAEFVPVSDTSGFCFMSKVRRPKYGENCVLIRADVRLWEGVVKTFGIRIRVLVEHNHCTLHEEDIENNWYKINLVFNGDKMEDVEYVADKICMLYNGYRHDPKKRKERYRFENAIKGEDPTCIPTPPSTDDEDSRSDAEEHISFGPDSSSTMTKMVDDIQIQIYSDDLTRFTGDAIVCATDYDVSCSAGISHAVLRQGGESVKKDIKRFKSDYGSLECASAMHTTAGNLPCSYVMFTVGPSWRYRDSKQCFQDLEDTVQNCLKYANDSLRIKSIGIPAISAGAQGGPMDMVAEAMKMGVYHYTRTIRTSRKLKYVCFINIDPVMTGLIQEAFETEDSRYSARVAYMFSGGLHFGREEDKPIYQAILSSAPDPPAPLIFPDEEPPPPPEVEEDCPICISPMERRTTLKCGHSFCKDCVTKAFETKPTCPICQRSYGLVVGNQPINAEMQVEERHDESLPGYEGYGLIIITYHIGDGVQGPEHPNPGQIYEGTVRQAFLPATAEGRTILRMLRLAFDRRLTFTVGRSATTGRDNVVIWNDIHHKTSTHGGPESLGYPDDQYLERVKYELACKGIE